MTRVAAALAAALLLGLAGCGGSEDAAPETVTVTQAVTETVAQTATETAPAAADPSLPAPVAQTRAALLAAAESGDYEELRPLVPDELRYTFGESTPGGAVEYWQRLERETGESPIRILAGILRLPQTYFQGLWVWPFAYAYTSAGQLTDDERELLRDVGGADLSDSFAGDAGYAGWRAGIAPDGSWLYFVAGD